MERVENKAHGLGLNLEIAALALALPWAVYVLNLVSPWDLRQFGIRPRELWGLTGIVFAPFLHAGLWHIVANSGALFFLMLIGLILNRRAMGAALLIIVFLGGGLVWLFGGRAVHIGASGVVFGLIGYLLTAGWFHKSLKAALGSLAVLVLYGGALFTLLVYVPGISWSSHFFGLLAGVVAAWATRPKQGAVG